MREGTEKNGTNKTLRAPKLKNERLVTKLYSRRELAFSTDTFQSVELVNEKAGIIS